MTKLIGCTLMIVTCPTMSVGLLCLLDFSVVVCRLQLNCHTVIARLRIAELQAEAVRPGVAIEHYFRWIGCETSRGDRAAAILSIDTTPGESLPVGLDTGEALPLTNLMQRRRDSTGDYLSTEASTKNIFISSSLNEFPTALIGQNYNYFATVPVDLRQVHDHDEIKLHASFSSARAAGGFVKDYALNMNTTVIWSVTIAQRCSRGESAKSTRKTLVSKLAHIATGFWYVSKFNLTHAQFCNSIANPTARQLLNQPGFNAAILDGHSTSRSRIVNNLKEVDGIDFSDKHAVVNRAIRTALEKMECDPVAEFNALLAFMKLFASRNDGSRVCCQLDSAGRFYRSFLSIGSLMQQQHIFLPVWKCDGTHMKDPDYNGICITLVGKDGDKHVISVAVAYVHKETTDNFV
ncbi:hypothetical protein GQ600_22274 [Phytophthora cactorum]|nr:hypothetical protein GQ600_22274 [Phytophthora cactorum]